MSTLIEKLRQIAETKAGEPAPKCLCGDEIWTVLLAEIAKEAADALEPRPIETAPQDGTRIMAFAANVPHGSKWRVTWWRTPEERAGYIGWGEFNTSYWPPTHWLPIPPDYFLPVGSTEHARSKP